MSPSFFAAVVPTPVAAVESAPRSFASSVTLRARSVLAESADAAFAAGPYLALRRVTCEVERGALVLRGRLPSYYLRQVALATAKKIAGVRTIVDRLEVCLPEDAGPTGSFDPSFWTT